MADFAAGCGLFSSPRNSRNITLLPNVWETSTLKQKRRQNNRGFYWVMVTARGMVFEPPFEFCAVIVIMFSPVGKGSVK